MPSKVVDMFSRLASPKGDYGLTAREREILQCLVDGLPKKVIADKLFLSFHTIDMHMRGIYTKLQVHSRSGAVAKALKENLL
jgi:DNA-binding NarL/FixJ family response regulator